MKTIEDILDIALERLAAGETADEILAQFPQQRSELEPLLSLAASLQKIPRLAPPLPMRRQKYLEKKGWDFSLNPLLVLKFGTVSLVAIIAVFTFETVYALPGTALFGFKKAAEQAQVKFAASTSDQQAELEINLAQKRLQEARTVLAESNSPEQKTAAIIELHQQTQKAIEASEPVIAAKAVNNDSKPLDNLIALNNQVESLTSSVAPTDDNQELTKANKDKIASLIATANEVALAPVLKNSDIIVKGKVKILSNQTLNVNGLSFKLNPETVIKSDSATANLDASALSSESIINISGVKDKSGEFLATSIVVVSASTASDLGQVKDAVTEQAPNQSQKAPLPAKPKSEQPETPITVPPANDDSNRAVGSYIPEP